MNEPQNYTLIFEPPAWRELMALPEEAQNRILDAAYRLESQPRLSGCKKLKGAGNKYRIRVGNYRLIYTIEDDVLVVLVVQVGKRDEVY